MTVGDEFAADLRLTQCKLKQTTDTIDSAPARVRHAIECVRYAAHATFECRSCVFIPGIAVSSAYADSVRVKILDRFERSRQFWRDRDAFDHICVLEQLPHCNR